MIKLVADRPDKLTIASVTGEHYTLEEDLHHFYWCKHTLEPIDKVSTKKRTVKEKNMGVQAGLNSLLGTIESEINSKIDEEVKKVNKKLKQTLQEVDEKIMSGVSLNITYDNKTTRVTGLKHQNFTKLLQVAGQRIPIMLVGEAGTGKTHGAKQVADALGLEFYSMSVGSQTSKTDIDGYMNATGNYVKGVTYDWAKGGTLGKGAVLCLDEIDAGNSNVTISLNSLLSNGYKLFPNGEMVQVHPNSVFIATANTFGFGASRQYVGRNQLDAATLDRFVTIDWDLDEKLESKLASVYTFGEAWLKTIKDTRKYAYDNGLKMIISPRATLNGSKMLEVGLDKQFVVDTTIVKSAPESSKDGLRQFVLHKFEEYSKGIELKKEEENTLV
jgi:MoxR-like ATPase